MKTIKYILTTLFSLFLGSILNAKNSQPNIILFYVDDLGWMDLGIQGSEFYETPAIDKLATQGVRFTQAYTAHPRCVPARYSIMTGCYPARGGVPGSGGLSPEDYTLAEALRDGGYKTFFAGKWHLLFEDEEGNMPENQGFDINVAGGASGAPSTYFYPYRTEKKTASGQKGFNKGELHGLEDGGEEGEYLTDRLTKESVNFLKDNVTGHRDQPFFLFLSHYGVHTPFEAKEALVKKYKEKLKTMVYDRPEYEKTETGDNKLRQDFPVYAAMIESIDQSLAKIMATLDELALTEETIIIFTADNGGLSARGNTRKLATSNYPLRYGKGWLYEGGIREAFIVKWSEQKEQGVVSDAIVSGTDLYPTLMHIAGIKPKTLFDGIDVTEAFKGNTFERLTPLFWHSPMGRPNSTGDRNSSAVRLGDYKLIDKYEEGVIELYNLKEDIKEVNNLAEVNKLKAEELKRLLDHWKRSINAETVPIEKNRWYD